MLVFSIDVYVVLLILCDLKHTPHSADFGALDFLLCFVLPKFTANCTVVPIGFCTCYNYPCWNTTLSQILLQIVPVIPISLL